MDNTHALSRPPTWTRNWPSDIRSRRAQWNVLGRVGSYDSFVGLTPSLFFLSASSAVKEFGFRPSVFGFQGGRT
jgi:hypothetical protein